MHMYTCEYMHINIYKLKFASFQTEKDTNKIREKSYFFMFLVD